ncbi:MAG: bifunctional alpha/beta hydrolase/OsmC family protein, partial [Pseudomonadota bacterium]
MPGQPVQFENSSGHTLTGLLDRPSVPHRATALFAHCFTCSKDLKAVSRIARALTDAGIAVLRFDFTGLGESGGDFADSSFSTNISDVVDAAGWLQDNLGGPDVLIGHSLGGTAMLAAAGEISSAKAVATIGSPAIPAHLRHLLGSNEAVIRNSGEAEVTLGGRPFLLRRQFVEDLDAHDMTARIANLRKALMVMHAPLDTNVEIENAADIYSLAKHPKSFVSLDDADHLLTRERDARYVGSVLAAWATRYLEDNESDDGPEPDVDVVSATTRAGGFRTDIVAAGHRLTADEPLSVGGTNLGPSPYDLLSAALAACTTMTLQMYARHKKLPLDTATVRVRHGRIHATDCGDCEATTGKVDEFQRDVIIEGDLTDAQRRRMLEIADRCPVHRTLHSEVKVRST